MGIGIAIDKGTHDQKASARARRGNNNNNNPNRIRFTQMWSTGHVGTRYLTGLLAAPGYFEKDDDTTNPSSLSSPLSNYMAWNERELPRITPKGSSLYGLSLYDFKAMMVHDNLPNNAKGRKHFRQFIPQRYKIDGKLVTVDGWYGGLQVKDWNAEGNTAALKSYLVDQRMPALRSVYERYNNRNEELTHFIKVGHTAVFSDLSDYYEVLSSTALRGDSSDTLDVDFVRIVRNRIDVASSFLGDGARKGPVGYQHEPSGIVTNPAMKTALLRLASVDGGILPDELWWNWTIFQRYLWFSDEVEARWRVFLKKHPEVRYYEISYERPTPGGSDPSGTTTNTNTNTTIDNLHQEEQQQQRPLQPLQLTPESIDDLALNFLGIGRPLSPYMERVRKKSHIKSGHPKNSRPGTPNTPTKDEKEQQAIEYSRQAPWCLQYEGKTNKNDTAGEEYNEYYEYPKLDCGLLA